MHHKYPKYPQTLENDQNAPKWPKYHWILKNKYYTLETIENDLDIPKLSQSTLDFLDFGGILVCCKFLYSF